MDTSMKMKVLAELMETLKDEMEYSPEDFDEGLGKKKSVTMVQMKGDAPTMQKAEEMLGQDLDCDMEEGEDPKHQAMVMDEGMDEDEKLKQRLVKLRG